MDIPKAAADETLVFRYIISSTEMRHIERAERCVYLALAPDGRLHLRGEIPGCGEACHAELATLLLEYAMSCEGSPNADFWPSASRAFAGPISEAIAAAIAEHHPTATGEERGRLALEALLVPKEGAVASPPAGGRGSYQFAACPLCQAAASGGTQRVAGMAHELFQQVCRTTVETAAPAWTVSFDDDLRRAGHALRLQLTRKTSP